MDSGEDENIKFEKAYKTLDKIGKYFKYNINIIELNCNCKEIFKIIKEN